MERNLSVVLIAHNEENNIGRMIEGLLSYYDKEVLEIIVVDDASQDKTAAVILSWRERDPRVRLIKRQPPCGVGRALKTGFSAIDPKADYALSMDSDFIESLPEARRLIARVEKGDCDGVIGSRFIKGSRLINYPALKKIMNRLFHFVVKALFHLKQKDLTNNFKLYKTVIFKELPWKSDDYAMNAETGILPVISGYRVVEVPISRVGRDHTMGSSKFHIIRNGLMYIQVILYVRKLIAARQLADRKI